MCGPGARPSDGPLVSGKGFCAGINHLPRLATALAKVVVTARGLGLIAGDDNEHGTTNKSRQ
jgi:hypothetical protein